nr:MAG TPA: hypothetical protein [Bacteriophage sp.]
MICAIIKLFSELFCSLKSVSDLFAPNFVQTKSPSNLRLKSLFFA